MCACHILNKGYRLLIKGVKGQGHMTIKGQNSARELHIYSAFVSVIADGEWA